MELKLLLNAHYDDIGKVCLVSKYAIQTCNDPDFWIDKSVHQLQKGRDYFINIIPNINAVREKYLELYTLDGGVARGSERYIDVIEFINRAINSKRDYLVQYAINRNFINWGYAIYLYFFVNEDDLAIDLIKKAPNINSWKLVAVALSMNDPDFFVTISTYLKDNYNYTPNYNTLLDHAIRYNNFKIIPNLLDNTLTWDDVIEKTISINPDLLNAILDEASEDETYDLNLNQVAFLAITLHKKNAFDDAVEYGGSDYEWDWEYLLMSAIDTNDVAMLKHIISVIPENTPIDKNLLKTENTVIQTMIDNL